MLKLVLLVIVFPTRPQQVGDVVTLATQQLYGTSHEVHGAEAVGKTRMVGPGVHQIGHADLLDASKSLEIRVFYNVEMQLVRNVDETINRVVEDFLFVGGCGHELQILPQR